MEQILSIVVRNQPGVLMRVAGMFSRRGFNIDSLAVGITQNPEFSRMTVTMQAAMQLSSRSANSWPSWSR